MALIGIMVAVGELHCSPDSNLEPCAAALSLLRHFCIIFRGSQQQLNVDSSGCKTDTFKVLNKMMRDVTMAQESSPESFSNILI